MKKIYKFSKSGTPGTLSLKKIFSDLVTFLDLKQNNKCWKNEKMLLDADGINKLDAGLAYIFYNSVKSITIYFPRVKQWFYVTEHFFGTFWQNFRKMLERFQIQNPEMTSIFFLNKWAVFEKILYFLPQSSYQISEKSSDRFLRYGWQADLHNEEHI